MIADTRKFGNMTQLNLREELKAVKAQAKALTYSMDFLIRQISFDEGEFKKWDRLRDALIDFEELEVNSGTPVMVMIPPERLTKLNMAYGPKVGDAINKMIDDLTVTDTTKGAAISAIEHFKVYFLNVRRCIKSAAGIHQYLLYSPGIRYIIYIKGDIIWKKIVQNKRCVNF